MTAPVLMVVGTASSVGKSTLVAALCRIAARHGIRVAPFKAQNMSNNAAVTADGGEIARSVAVQAEAAGISPSIHMNPILIKPEGAQRSQIMVEGRPWRSLEARDYWGRKDTLWPIVTRNLDMLRAEYDLVIAEGAGSPVELNLKARDIVNMRVARYAEARTLLVGDIDVGGIFAALLGTLLLLEPEERALIRGLVVNRFRGDPALFADGVQILEQRSDLPVLGVVPWLERMGLAEEDAAPLERTRFTRSPGNCKIAVIQIPAIANFDDFDPLAREPGVRVHYVSDPTEIGEAAAVILPGTKHTLAARRWLHERGFDGALRRFPGAIVGICGGYQLLGERISDLQQAEGNGGDELGLGLLPVQTIFALQKHTAQVVAISLAPFASGVVLRAYEIHMGQTTQTVDAPALARITQRGGAQEDQLDGCSADNGRIWGCYLHGLFGNDQFRQAWLRTLGWQPTSVPTPTDPYDRLADHVERALDAVRLQQLLQPHA